MPPGGLFLSGCLALSIKQLSRHGHCWFNAPSREAIYKQIMQLSEGPEWAYDYETFVAADSAGREQAAEKYKIWKEAYENFWAEQDAQMVGKESMHGRDRLLCRSSLSGRCLVDGRR